MKFLGKTVLLSLGLLLYTYGSNLTAQYVPGELLIEVKEGITTEKFKETLSKYFLKFKLKKLHNSNIYLVKIIGNKTQNITVLSNMLSSESSIKVVEPNFIIKAFAYPNDEYYPYQWALEKIETPFAWNFTTGDNQTVIGVIDTGIDINHSDLKGNLWINQGELLGIDGDGNGIDDGCENNADDDINGYVDDCYGFNAILGRGSALDDNGHGTHVAGIIGAVGNNGTSITGLNWSISIIGCKFLDSRGYGTLADALECYNYIKTLKQNGVPIIGINASYGHYGLSTLEQNAISELEALGILVVAAAGNETNNNDVNPVYPCAFSTQFNNVICVAATDENDNLAYFSNHGVNTVQVAAPGVNIFSTYLSQLECSDLIFEDNMESGSLNWITYGTNNRWLITQEAYVSPSHAWSDSPYFNYLDYTDSYLELNTPVDLSGVTTDVCVSFNVKWALEPYFDYMYLQAYNGNYWQTFITFNGFSDWQTITLQIPYSFHQSTSTFKLRFNLDSDCCINFDGVYIDDVKIGLSTEYNTQVVMPLSGTSMAAPFVTGLVGLLKSYANNLTASEIKDIILSSVDKVPSLNGFVKTGGRINAFKAILALDNLTIPKNP